MEVVFAITSRSPCSTRAPPITHRPTGRTTTSAAIRVVRRVYMGSVLMAAILEGQAGLHLLRPVPGDIRRLPEVAAGE